MKIYTAPMIEAIVAETEQLLEMSVLLVIDENTTIDPSEADAREFDLED